MRLTYLSRRRRGVYIAIIYKHLTYQLNPSLTFLFPKAPSDTEATTASSADTPDAPWVRQDRRTVPAPARRVHSSMILYAVECGKC